MPSPFGTLLHSCPRVEGVLLAEARVDDLSRWQIPAVVDQPTWYQVRGSQAACSSPWGFQIELVGPSSLQATHTSWQCPGSCWIQRALASNLSQLQLSLGIIQWTARWRDRRVSCDQFGVDTDWGVSKDGGVTHLMAGSPGF